MSLVGVMRLLGHQDIRMTLRYAAVTPEIVAEEYQSALEKLATKYRLPPTPATAPPEPEGAPDPDQLLDHLARWVRKHAAHPAAPRDLLRRIEDGGITEVVLATNSTMTGEATAAYLADRLRDRVTVTRLASGLPVGGDLEYADEVTLGRALAGRRPA
jgi:hypothetical protein